MSAHPFGYNPDDPRAEHVLSLLCDHIRSAHRRLSILVSDPVKSREQEEKYHAIIGEIARAKVLYGKHLSPESWKRLLIDAFKHETKDDPDYADDWKRFGSIELIPALNHDGFVLCGEQSRKFTKHLASGFIAWLEAFQATSDREAA